MNDDPRNCGICGHPYTKCTCAPTNQADDGLVDIVYDLRHAAGNKALSVGDAWNLLEMAADKIESLRSAPVISEEMVEMAHREYERFGQVGDLKTVRISDACMRRILTAALSLSRGTP